MEKKKWLDRKDWILMGIMTLLFFFIALWNLGSLKAPTTSWTPSERDEYIIADLGKEVTLSRIYYYCGLGHERPDRGVFGISYSLDGKTFSSLLSIKKQTYGKGRCPTGNG